MELMQGFELGNKLYKAGFLPTEDVRRIVIDIPCDGCVTIYYECFGDKKILNLTIEELIKNKDKVRIVPVGEKV